MKTNAGGARFAWRMPTDGLSAVGRLSLAAAAGYPLFSWAAFHWPALWPQLGLALLYGAALGWAAAGRRGTGRELLLAWATGAISGAALLIDSPLVAPLAAGGALGLAAAGDDRSAGRLAAAIFGSAAAAVGAWNVGRWLLPFLASHLWVWRALHGALFGAAAGVGALARGIEVFADPLDREFRGLETAAEHDVRAHAQRARRIRRDVRAAMRLKCRPDDPLLAGLAANLDTILGKAAKLLRQTRAIDAHFGPGESARLAGQTAALEKKWNETIDPAIREILAQERALLDQQRRGAAALAANRQRAMARLSQSLTLLESLRLAIVGYGAADRQHTASEIQPFEEIIASLNAEIEGYAAASADL